MNALRRGDTLPVGQVMETHVALPELAERAWAALGTPTAPRAPHVKVGRGLACNFQPYGRIVWLHDWSSAWIGFEMDGSLVVRCGAPDVGGGQASSLCQIAAEVLGVPLDRIVVHVSDSALTPLAGTTTASRQLYMSGNAVPQGRPRAARAAPAGRGADARRRGRDARDDGRRGRRAGRPRRSRCATLLAQCARAGVPRSHLGVYHAPAGEPVDLHAGAGKVFPDYTFGAHAAEVEVDTETGQVRVLKYAAAHDVGRAINPQSVEGQIQGGAVQGLGYGLMEEVVVEDGINLTTSFATYLIPSAGRRARRRGRSSSSPAKASAPSARVASASPPSGHRPRRSRTPSRTRRAHGSRGCRSPPSASRARSVSSSRGRAEGTHLARKRTRSSASDRDSCARPC